MSQKPLFFLWIATLLVSTGPAKSAEREWDEHLAAAFSGSLRDMNEEIRSLETRLPTLPRIPIDDQSGTGGIATIHGAETATESEPITVEVRWQEPGKVDLIGLVPARRYDVRGLDPHYGMPDEFTIELIDAAGKSLGVVAREENTHQHPVRNGHPFVYRVSPPVEASGLRISALRLLPDPESEGSHVHAWAEVFAFNGETNLALRGDVRRVSGSASSAPWQWAPEFLVDGQTPLGLPEIPAEDHRLVGWISNGKDNPNDTVALTMDLGEIKTIDGLRLLPARRPTSDLPSGFGFPRKLAILVSEDAEPGPPDQWKVAAEFELTNPGHNPMTLAFNPIPARHVRLETRELWKRFDSYPAFFALSEIEILNENENLALGKQLRSSDGMLNIVGPGGRYWSVAALTDGFGPDGKLASTREWVIQLDQRLQMETRLHELGLETTRLVARWRNTALTIFILLGLAGAVVMIALPLSYRVRSRRELIRVRERIAGDLHDEVGSNLGSIQMFANLAEERCGQSDELKRIQRIASETVSAVRDIVWLLRPGGEHRIAAVEHLRETSSIMLESLDWKFHASPDAWRIDLPDDSNRHLFLFFREALHNILRHSEAKQVEITMDTGHNSFVLNIRDNGIGVAPERLDRPATFRALCQRAHALGADLNIDTSPGKGTSLRLSVPIKPKKQNIINRILRRSEEPSASEPAETEPSITKPQTADQPKPTPVTATPVPTDQPKPQAPPKADPPAPDLAKPLP